MILIKLTLNNLKLVYEGLNYFKLTLGQLGWDQINLG